MNDSKARQALTTAIEEVGTGFLVVVTGAGVSLASGIPTFRGADPGAVRLDGRQTVPSLLQRLRFGRPLGQRFGDIRNATRMEPSCCRCRSTGQASPCATAPSSNVRLSLSGVVAHELSGYAK